MTKGGLEVFDTTLQKTYLWLNDLMEYLEWDDRHKAYLALRATLHALRDRLTLETAVKVSAQFPMLLRGVYFEGWKPASTPIKIKNSEEFLDFVSSYFSHTALTHETDKENIVRAVFQVITNHISSGEVHHIRGSLPQAIADLWPSKELDKKAKFKKV